MSDLTNVEKRKFERLLEMGGGYVLNFSNRTFEEFVTDATGRNIYDSRYEYGSGSNSSSTVGDASWPQLVDSKQGDACQREILVSRLICK